ELLRVALQRIEARLQALYILPGRGLLRLDLRQALVAQRLDVLHRGIGAEEEIVVLLLRGLPLVRAGLRRQLPGRLLRIDVSDRHTLTVQDLPAVAGVLRRNAVAIVDDAMLVDPAVSDALVTALRPSRSGHAGEREQQREGAKRFAHT